MKCSDEDIGKRIKGLRQKRLNEHGRKFTQDDLANAVGLSRTIIAKIETGIQPLLPAQLNDIAKFFGVSSDYLLTGVSTENMTVANELGLSEEAIVTLQKMKFGAADESKSAIAEYDRDVLFSINALLSNTKGQQLLENICHYLVTDFDNAHFSVENIWIDENGQRKYYHEENKEPIKDLYFERAVPGMGKGASIPCGYMKYVLLREIDSEIDCLRNDIISQQGISYSERRKLDEELMNEEE